MKLSLRLKMIFAFSFVVIAAIAAVVLFANLDSEQQVRTYLNQGGLYGMNDLVNQLESHYADTGGLAGSETIIQNYRFRGKGRNPQSSNPNMTLVDGNRQVLWSSSG